MSSISLLHGVLDSLLQQRLQQPADALHLACIICCASQQLQLKQSKQLASAHLDRGCRVAAELYGVWSYADVAASVHFDSFRAIPATR